MKTNKKRVGASTLALALAMGFGGFATADDKASLKDAFDAPNVSATLDGGNGRQKTNSVHRDAIRRRGDSSNAVEQARRLIRGRQENPTANVPATTGKRYLVAVLGTEDYNPQTGRCEEDPLAGKMIGSYNVALDALQDCGFTDAITLAGEWANREQFAKLFDILSKQTQPGDEIFFYWNGHGGVTQGEVKNEAGNVVAVQAIDILPQDEADGADEYIALCGGPMLDDELPTLFKKLEGRRVFAFFETCHAGGLAAPQGLRGADSFDGPAPTLPSVDTWQDLKSKADATAKLRDEELRQAFLTVYPLSEAIKPKEEEKDDLKATFNAGAKLSRGASQDSSALVFKASEASVDLSADTLKEFAAVFTSKEDENSATGTAFLDENDVPVCCVANPGAFAIYALTQEARQTGKAFTVADLMKKIDAMITTTQTLIKNRQREIGVQDDSTQTPVYLSNMDDAVIYAPK